MTSFLKVGEAESECLSACDDQVNSVSVTSSDFPNRETFVRREEFCLTLLKLRKTCSSPKRAFLVAKLPTVCDNIERIVSRIAQGVRNASSYESPAAVPIVCTDLEWDPVRIYGFQREDRDLVDMEEDIFVYAKKNLAVVNVYIKDPVVTRILRDQKIPVIAFVANTGGLLGLCMGFSLVSVFEVLYHVLGAFREWRHLRLMGGAMRRLAAATIAASATPAQDKNKRGVATVE
jgi:hypothetical protein